ncbi:uncharacterized protein LOC114526455 isoform X2 [Dendronephthya gigantea]|uniref:uncharacterized protein LOC114526455 isoform X2 n=1 Tax=Dendronephthya gigantea TaxID=151771 RepID=UPI00106CB8CD|nr:uncharacterized protein LOC114526455 isoform X2 [Dendronephthya gigantea]
MDVREETVEEHYPTTTTFRPRQAQIHILRNSRHVSKKTYHPLSGFNEKRLQFDEQSCLIVQFDFGIMDEESKEFWRCEIKQDILRAQLYFVGGFRILPTVLPPYSQSSSIKLKGFDCNNKQFLPYFGGVAFELPVLEERPATFGLRITLYKEDAVLHSAQFNVKSHGDGIELDECQSGALLPSIETPYRKKQMTGALAKLNAQKVLNLFQKLGDNGEHAEFAQKQSALVNNLGEKKFFTDLILAVELQRGITKYGQNKMDECLTICQRIRQKTEESFSQNSEFILGRVFYIMSGVHRQQNQFELALKYLNLSTENFMKVFECSETGNNRYNLAALYAQKAAHCRLTSEEYKLTVESFEDAIRMYKLHEKNGPKRIRNIIRTSNRQILFYLKGSRSNFPDLNLEVSGEDIAKAYKVIEDVEKLLPECPKRHECTFLIPKADYLIRKATSRELTFFYDEAQAVEQGKRHLHAANDVLERAKQLSVEMRMTKETVGINQRIERIEHLLQGGLREFFDRRRQTGRVPDSSVQTREFVNETNDIYDLILNVRLENLPDRNQWQCTEPH